MLFYGKLIDTCREQGWELVAIHMLYWLVEKIARIYSLTATGLGSTSFPPSGWGKRSSEATQPCKDFRNSMEKSDSFITFKLLQINLPLVVKSWKVTENVRWQNKALLMNCWCHSSCAVESSEPKNVHARFEQRVWLLLSSLFYPQLQAKKNWN